MRAFVTGATGFVGRALVRRLQAEGDSVRALTRGEGGAIDGVELLHGDLLDLEEPERLLASIDTVIHLAGLADGGHDSNDYDRINHRATAALAAAAKDAGVRRFVYLSTVKVHGETSGVSPIRETDALSPDGAYASSKAAAEDAVRNTLDSGATDWVVIRSPLVYGAGAAANFQKLVRVVEAGVPLPFATVENARSLIYVENLVDAIRLVASAPGASRETFLVSDGVDLSTPELVRRIADGLGRPPRLLPAPVSAIRALMVLAGRRGWSDRLTRSLAVDIGKIHALGWTPPFTQTDAMRLTLEASARGDAEA